MPILVTPSPTRLAPGYTLVELAIVLGLLASLGAIAGPPLAGMLRRQQVESARMAVQASLHHARELAVRSGRRVVVCPTDDQRRCSGSTDWGRGWLIGHASVKDQLDGPPLQVGQPTSRRTTITAWGSGGRRGIAFRPRGGADGSNITLLFCRRGDTRDVLALAVSNPGRINTRAAEDNQRKHCAAPP